VQRVHARVAAVGFGDLERLAAEPAPAMALGDIKLVDERLAAAIFEAEAERHRDVADHRVALASDPQPAEVRILDQRERRSARLGFHERVAVLLVVAAHHPEDVVHVAGSRLPKARHRRSRARCRNQTRAMSASAGM